MTTTDLALATLLQQSATIEYVNDNACARLDVETQDLNPIVEAIAQGYGDSYAVVTYSLLSPRIAGLNQLLSSNKLRVELKVVVSNGAYGPYLALDRCALSTDRLKSPVAGTKPPQGR